MKKKNVLCQTVNQYTFYPLVLGQGQICPATLKPENVYFGNTWTQTGSEVLVASKIDAPPPAQKKTPQQTNPQNNRD